MDFRVLGPVEMEDDNGVVRVDGLKQRIILAALLVGVNEVTSLSRLVDWLWGRRPPKSAATVVQGYISRLRRVVEPEREPWAPARVLVRRSPGYLLRIEPEQLDVLRFERLTALGRAALDRGEPELASQALSAALDLWRGQALADIAFVEAAQADIARMQALRLSAIAMRVDADLALGRHGALVPELERLVREHPLDECLTGQLMIALCRCGRRAESLSVYEGVRARLARELHVEPAPASQRLAAAILAQHPDLDLRASWDRARPHLSAGRCPTLPESGVHRLVHESRP